MSYWYRCPCSSCHVKYRSQCQFAGPKAWKTNSNFANNDQTNTTCALKKGVCFTAAEFFVDIGGQPYLSCKKYRYKIQGNLNSELINDKQVMMFVKSIL